MPSGSCLCGSAKYSFQGEPATKALCHCIDCRKISGGSHSVNYIVSGEGFQSSGTKTFAKTADSGNTITSHLCSECGTTLFRDGASFGPNKVVKVGTLDDPKSIEEAKPAVELFAGGRPSWQQQVAGSSDIPGMPS